MIKADFEQTRQHINPESANVEFIRYKSKGQTPHYMEENSCKGEQDVYLRSKKICIRAETMQNIYRSYVPDIPVMYLL